jgi:hypothetical protein
MSIGNTILDILTIGQTANLRKIGTSLQTAASKTDSSKGIGAIEGTFGNLLSNIGSGKILAPSAIGNTGSAAVDKVLSIATSPVGILGVAGIGAGAVTGVKFLISGGQGGALAKGAAGTAGGGAAAGVGAKALGGSDASKNSVPSASNPESLPKTVEPSKPKEVPTPDKGLPQKGTEIPSTSSPPAPKSSEPPKSTGEQQITVPKGDIVKAGQDMLQTTLNKGTDTKNTSTTGSTSNPPKKKATKKKKTPTKKAKTSKARKSTAKKVSSKSRKEKYKAPSRYGSGKQYKKKGGKEVYYTKTGQPYILMASGKAKFIKR